MSPTSKLLPKGRVLRLVLVTGGVTLLLGGCAYDYMQRTDRVAYHSGDAVKANLEAQTVDPANPDARSVKGLGRNGVVTPGVAPAP